MKKSYIALLVLLVLALFSFSACEQESNEQEHKHSYTEKVIVPTCQAKGYTNRVCTDCGETTNYNYTALADCSPCENWVVTKEATCTQVGEKQKKCITCGRVLEREVIPLAEHQPVETITRVPTCLDTGIKTTTCNACNKLLHTEPIEKNNTHDFELFTNPPTETSLGSTTYICKKCNHTEQGDYVEIKSGLTATEVYEIVSASTVRVESYDKAGKLSTIGTGFFYAPQGKLITNYHVIASAYTIKLLFYDGTRCEVASILGYNRAEDVAILQADYDNQAYLEISTENVKTGDTVYALGNPLGVNNIFTAGMVSNQSISISGKECIAFTAPISPGNSGGPLLNSEGKVVGINSMYIPEAQNLNFAILIDKATSLSTESPVTSQAHYISNLSTNAFDIFASYIVNNYTSTDGEVYVMLFEEKETAETAGFEYRYVFDSEKNEIFIEVAIINKGQIKYVFDLYLPTTNGGKSYASLYDLNANQTTIEAQIPVSNPNVDYETSFWMFSIVKFRYDTADTQNTDLINRFFYSVYDMTTEHLKNTLKKSYTGLTISSFGYSWTYSYEEPINP